MFDSLSDQMKADEKASSSTAEVMLRWAAAAVIAVLVFGGLYFGVRLLE